jgi:hypothetical protein
MANHSIVQTLNYIGSYPQDQPKLTTLDRLLLVLLARRNGSKGIFPSQLTLAKEANVIVKSVRRRLKYLQKINLLTITKINKSHHYTIHFLTNESYPQGKMIGDITTPYIGDTRDPYEQNIGDICDHSKGTFATKNRGHQRPPNSKDNSKEKREEKKPQPSLSDFELTSEEQERCKVKGIDSTLLKEKFILHAKASGKSYVDPHAAFQLWIEREAIGQKVYSEVATSNVVNFMTEDNCADCARPKFSCRCKVSTKEFAAEQMKKIMGQLKGKMLA